MVLDLKCEGMEKTMAAKQNEAADAPYLSEEVIELLDLISQLRSTGMVQDAPTIAAFLLFVKQIRFLRDDLANK